MAKQAALAFVKRTLEQCHKYEETGKSCFSEPLFRDIFLSGSNINSARQADYTTEGESGKGYASIRYLEGRISGIFLFFCIMYKVHVFGFIYHKMSKCLSFMTNCW